MAGHSISLLFLFILILFCFKGLKESIDISQEKGKKGKEKTLGYYKGSERKKEDHREARGNCLGWTKGRTQEGKGAKAGFISLEGWRGTAQRSG